MLFLATLSFISFWLNFPIIDSDKKRKKSLIIIASIDWLQLERGITSGMVVLT